MGSPSRRSSVSWWFPQIVASVVQANPSLSIPEDVKIAAMTQMEQPGYRPKAAFPANPAMSQVAASSNRPPTAAPVSTASADPRESQGINRMRLAHERGDPVPSVEDAARGRAKAAIYRAGGVLQEQVNMSGLHEECNLALTSVAADCITCKYSTYLDRSLLAFSCEVQERRPSTFEVLRSECTCIQHAFGANITHNHIHIKSIASSVRRHGALYLSIIVTSLADTYDQGSDRWWWWWYEDEGWCYMSRL